MRGLGSWRNLRVGLVIIVFVISLAALLGGRGLAESIRLTRPLARGIESIKGIRGYALQRNEDGIHLSLDMERVGDLESAITRAVTLVEGEYKEPVREIRIQDQRRGLDDAYYDLRFSLEEAAATGRYTRLQGDLARLSAAARLDKARVYLSRNFIYVQLEKGSSYLYEALPRPLAVGAVSAAGGGI